MLKFVRTGTTCRLIFMALILAGCTEYPTAPVVGDSDAALDPQMALQDIPPSKLGEYWWRWYLHANPGNDVMSSPEVFCHNQKVDANGAGTPWVFLAGSGGAGAVRRTCRVEAGRHLVMPILTTMSLAQPWSMANCAERARAEGDLNDIAPEMHVTVDGQAVRDMAQRRIRDSSCPQLQRGAGFVYDGYWLILKPLAPGNHVIAFKAAYNSDYHPLGHLSQDVVYYITVR